MEISIFLSNYWKYEVDIVKYPFPSLGLPCFIIREGITCAGNKQNLSLIGSGGR